MKDLRKITRKMGFKNQSIGPWEIVNTGYTDGVGKCGHYDVELGVDGYCRDEECRRKRLKRALEIGEAVRLNDGTIIWTDGVKIGK